MPTDCTGLQCSGDVQSAGKLNLVDSIQTNQQTTNKKMSSFKRGTPKDRAGMMQSLIKNSAVTQDGADWATLRMDPYHDFQRPVAGYPDADCFNTVVSCLNYETNVSKPAGSVGNWDAHVFTMPFTHENFYLGTCTDGQYVQTADSFTMGLVSIAKDDTGGIMFPTAVPVASANFSMGAMNFFTEVETGMSRIIGMGIEIIDTTAELYKQGAITCYRMPSIKGNEMSIGYLNSAASMQSQASVCALMSPPSDVSEAVAYPSTVQWQAKDGAYMCIGQEGIDNPFATDTRQSCLVTSDPQLWGALPVLMTGLTACTALQAPPLLTAATGSFSMKFVNVAQQGIFITGLANTATFKIRTRVYVERAPMRTETSLIPLCSPSAMYDYKALALYSVLISELPIAVPVDFNAKGDWWRWIVRTVRKLAPVLGAVLTPIVGPEAAVIGQAVGQVAEAIPTKKSQVKMPMKRKNQKQLRRIQN